MLLELNTVAKKDISDEALENTIALIKLMVKAESLKLRTDQTERYNWEKLFD